LPVACSALWQVAQVPATTDLWSKAAGFQALVVWQRAQSVPYTG
jgi:hypothetical protein